MDSIQKFVANRLSVLAIDEHTSNLPWLLLLTITTIPIVG